ncbi:MAG: hypothetical protein PVF68_15455 [Acidobacteriota bacterium]|jgi:hypothetical protein
MRRAWIIAALVTMVVVAGMLWLLGTRKPAPRIPADADHAVGEAACLECHPTGKPLPDTRNHALSQRCFQCHLRPGR